jgi:hypothetical protein
MATSDGIDISAWSLETKCQVLSEILKSEKQTMVSDVKTLQEVTQSIDSVKKFCMDVTVTSFLEDRHPLIMTIVNSLGQAAGNVAKINAVNQLYFLLSVSKCMKDDSVVGVDSIIRGTMLKNSITN